MFFIARFQPRRGSFLTAQPQPCAGLVLHGVFFNRVAVGWAVYARQAVYFLTAQPQACAV